MRNGSFLAECHAPSASAYSTSSLRLQNRHVYMQKARQYKLCDLVSHQHEAFLQRGQQLLFPSHAVPELGSSMSM
uniref:Uncharacterized protein n=1 Tax=Arundo donax TaxID=35708 RepID=A0A0A9CEV9_ARUDO